MDLVSKQRKVQHLYYRTGFGGTISEINNSKDKSLYEIADKIFAESKSYSPLGLDTPLEIFSKKKNDRATDDISKRDRQLLMQKSRENIRDLNIKWIERMSGGAEQLREKMTLFWHGHFACRTPIALFCQNQNNTIRKNALGKFGDLLMAVSKDPAMLQYLNNQQNKKSSPNENFAREVMELFTLGRDNYTEFDIKEAARAFTGWSFNREGEFQFRERIHDNGVKHFFAKSGNFSGEEIMNMLIEDRRTSKHVTGKIYKYFVNDNPDAEIVQDLADDFYESEYDIGKLMKKIFTSDWFYDRKNIGAKIKSPVELVAGMSRSFNISFRNPKPLLAIQKSLGQVLFNPPNVSGWAGGKSWIDTSSLVYRLKLPEIIFKSSSLDFDYKEDLPEMGEDYSELSKKERRQYKQLKTKTDLKEYVGYFSKFGENKMMDELSGYLLQVPADETTNRIVKSYSDDSSKENLIESLTLRIISLPEYQLC